MKVQVIVGSTRQGRVTNRVGAWVKNELNTMEGIEAEVIDLADYPMPFFDEAISPQYNPDRQPSAEVKKWLDKLAEADAYVIATPEYNRSTSGVLKNALDYIDFQMSRKPVALVAHGSTGGAQAVAQLRGILPGVLAVSVPQATFFSDRAAEHISEDGQLSEEVAGRAYGPLTALRTTLTELKWYGDSLAANRTNG